MKVYRVHPLAERQVGSLKQRPLANAEIRPAFRTPVVHMSVGSFARSSASARRAYPAVWPYDALQPLTRLFLGRKHLDQIDYRESLPKRFSRSPAAHSNHPFSVSLDVGNLKEALSTTVYNFPKKGLDTDESGPSVKKARQPYEILSSLVKAFVNPINAPLNMTVPTG